jgi:hypothetical protein
MPRRRRSAGQEFVATVRYIVVLLVFAWFMWNVVRPIGVDQASNIKLHFGQTAVPTASP